MDKSRCVCRTFWYVFDDFPAKSTAHTVVISFGQPCWTTLNKNSTPGSRTGSPFEGARQSLQHTTPLSLATGCNVPAAQSFADGMQQDIVLAKQHLQTAQQRHKKCTYRPHNRGRRNALTDRTTEAEEMHYRPHNRGRRNALTQGNVLLL
jgi:hypothetical protein